jgi:5-formyltetrahydrofolate cyclo-ligase
MEERKQLRKEKIQARNQLTAEERERLSKSIVERILSSEEFQRAETIMLYRGIKGEVRLNELEPVAKAQGKRLVFPLCISDREMMGLMPRGEDAWTLGYCGIQEPVREKSLEIPPEEIDMILCPCTAFDEEGGRMGMGAGFYDRFLTRCSDHCCIAAVAFQVQKTHTVLRQPWDIPMTMAFTESRTYRF